MVLEDFFGSLIFLPVHIPFLYPSIWWTGLHKAMHTPVTGGSPQTLKTHTLGYYHLEVIVMMCDLCEISLVWRL